MLGLVDFRFNFSRSVIHPEKIEIRLRKGKRFYLFGLYWKPEYGMLSAMDSHVLKNRQVKKKKLGNEFKITENNLLRQKKVRDDRKQKMLSLDENTGKMVT